MVQLFDDGILHPSIQQNVVVGFFFLKDQNNWRQPNVQQLGTGLVCLVKCYLGPTDNSYEDNRKTWKTFQYVLKKSEKNGLLTM